MSGRGLVVAIAVMASFRPAMAAERVDNYGPFQCVTPSDFENVSVTTEEMRLANFTVDEKLSTWNKQVAAVQINLAIQATVALYFGADFVLFDEDGNPIAAINANPPKFTVNKGKGAIAVGGTPVGPGTLAKAKKICMRWFAMPMPEAG